VDGNREKSISSGPRGMTGRKIKQIKVSFEPEHEIKQTREILQCVASELLH